MSEKKYTTRSRRRKMKNIRNWISFTFIYLIFMGLLYGTATTYYPTPIPLGLLYVDISIMIILLGIGIWALISAWLMGLMGGT